jgi:hypothetical protein
MRPVVVVSVLMRQIERFKETRSLKILLKSGETRK